MNYKELDNYLIYLFILLSPFILSNSYIFSVPKNIWTNISDLTAAVMADPLKFYIDTMRLYSPLSTDSLNSYCKIQVSLYTDWYTISSLL